MDQERPIKFGSRQTWLVELPPAESISAMAMLVASLSMTGTVGGLNS